MSRIYLVRHGEPAGAYGVAADPGLSALGQTQAQAIARRFSATPITAIWSSPLARCLETAAPSVAVLNLPLRVEPRVAEVVAPSNAHDRRAWLAGAFPRIAAPDAPVTTWRDVGLSDWRNNVVQALLGAASDTLVFSHFIAMNAAVSAALGVDETIVCWPAHTGVAIFSARDGRLHLEESPMAATTHVT